MDTALDKDVRRAVRMALAREAYAAGRMRLVHADLDGFRWLVTTHNGMFAVAPDRVMLVAHGWFFGVCRHADQVFLFENCGMRDHAANLGRIIRLDWDGRRLSRPEVLVTGLHANCHQIKVIGDLLCLVDTANQRIMRFGLDGRPVDIKTPFPLAPNTDTSGAYLHVNCLAEIDGKIAVLLHNGKVPGPRKSELVWLDSDWNVTERGFIDGYKCHDIVADNESTLWHCASEAGEIISSNGQRIKLSDQLMTRSLAFCEDLLLVGLSSFGERQVRDALAGEIVLLDSQGGEIGRHKLPAGPADAVALR